MRTAKKHVQQNSSTDNTVSSRFFPFVEEKGAQQNEPQTGSAKDLDKWDAGFFGSTIELL